MPKYRMTGQYYTAPDRGDPDGSWNRFENDFEAMQDEEAVVLARQILRDSYGNRESDELRNLSLFRLEQVEFVHAWA